MKQIEEFTQEELAYTNDKELLEIKEKINKVIDVVNKLLTVHPRLNERIKQHEEFRNATSFKE